MAKIVENIEKFVRTLKFFQKNAASLNSLSQTHGFCPREINFFALGNGSVCGVKL